jgi:hypothetical protein
MIKKAIREKKNFLRHYFKTIRTERKKTYRTVIVDILSLIKSSFYWHQHVHLEEERNEFVRKKLFLDSEASIINRRETNLESIDLKFYAKNKIQFYLRKKK